MKKNTRKGDWKEEKVRKQLEKFGNISRICDERKCNPQLCRQGKTNTISITLRCVIPVVCVTNEREESVFNQHN